MAHNQGVAQLPGFVESLRILLSEEQYTISDIAMMFLVSRERIRQIAAREGLHDAGPGHKGGLLAVRVWNDAEHRFRPIGKRTIRYQRSRAKIAARIAGRREKYAIRQAEAVHTLRELAAYLDRSPTIAELARGLGLPRNPGVIYSHLLPPKAGGPRGSLSFLWERAGLTPRGTGAPGHTRKRRPKTVCKRGHPLTFGMRCAECRRWLDKKRYQRRKGA